MKILAKITSKSRHVTDSFSFFFNGIRVATGLRIPESQEFKVGQRIQGIKNWSGNEEKPDRVRGFSRN